MGFGQQSGPPASAKQIKYLESLLQKAGFTGFRDARRPYGLTQRQAGGKFTTREASALIDQLIAGGEPAPLNTPTDLDVGGSLFPAPNHSERDPQDRLRENHDLLLRGIPAEMLIAELERRGYRVSPNDPF